MKAVETGLYAIRITKVSSEAKKKGWKVGALIYSGQDSYWAEENNYQPMPLDRATKSLALVRMIAKGEMEFGLAPVFVGEVLP